jgi:hypothetical protein
VLPLTHTGRLLSGISLAGAQMPIEWSFENRPVSIAQLCDSL